MAVKRGKHNADGSAKGSHRHSPTHGGPQTGNGYTGGRKPKKQDIVMQGPPANISRLLHFFKKK